MNASTEKEVAAAVVGLTGRGAHVLMDAIGSATTAVAAVNSLRPHGRHLQVRLLHGTDATPALPMAFVIGSFEGHTMP